MDAQQLRERIGSAVFDRSPCLISVIDTQHRIVLSNTVFEHTFVTDPGAVCHSVYKRSAAACEHCIADLTFSDGEERTSEEVGITGDDKEIRYRVQSIPLRNDAGAVDHVLLISTDITRVAALEQGLKQAERLANVGMTTAGLAHTIKNILAGLEGGTYVVESGIKGGNKERLESGWEMVQGYIEQVTALVKNLLSYARAKPATREPVDPGALVDNVVQLYQQKASQAGATLEAHVGDGLAPLALDREAMHAALTNLVSNAVDACMWDPDSDKSHRIQLSVTAGTDGGVLFEVEDNGPGISEENQRKVLSAFFTTKGIRGTGLGLLLTKKTVEEHNGTIAFSSTPGQGTSFRIELPADTGSPAETESGA